MFSAHIIATTKQRVLGLLAKFSDKEFYERQIARRIGISYGSIFSTSVAILRGAVKIIPGTDFLGPFTPFTAQGEQPAPPIGGEAFPPNKLLLLAPWMALLAVIIAGAVIFARRRQAKS